MDLWMSNSSGSVFYNLTVTLIYNLIHKWDLCITTDLYVMNIPSTIQLILLDKHYFNYWETLYIRSKIKLVLNKHKLQILWNNMKTFTSFLSFFLICLWRKTLLVMREHIVIILPRNWNTKGTINLVKLIIWAENVIMKTIRMSKYQL